MKENHSVESSVESSDGDLSTDFDNLYERLKQATGAKTDAELGQAMGIRQSSVSVAKKRKQIPPVWITKVSMGTGVSADWLLYGEGPMRRGERPAGAPDAACLPGYEYVKKVRARLSAGSGSLATSDEVEGYYAFRSDWLRKRGNPTTMVLMAVTGDSMSPEIEDEDTVLIDESQRDIYVGKKFAVAIDDEVYIKYIDREPGKYILRSVNPKYRPIEVDLLDESRDVRLIGRMIWLGRVER